MVVDEDVVNKPGASSRERQRQRQRERETLLRLGRSFFFSSSSFFNDSPFVVPPYDIVTDYRSSGENFKIKETRWKRDGRREGKGAERFIFAAKLLYYA